MKTGNPTKKKDWVKAGDIVVSVFVKPDQAMLGKVLRTDHKLSIPQATVKWESGSTGVHTITTLRRYRGICDIRYQAAGSPLMPVCTLERDHEGGHATPAFGMKES